MFLDCISQSMYLLIPLAEAQQAYLQGDYAKADELARPLAENGDILAQYNLGVMYANEKSEIHDYQGSSQMVSL